MKHFLILIFLTASQFVSSQAYNPLLPPNTFRNSDNPYYWKNRPPFPGYWQQDIYYNIKASIDEKTDIVAGSEQLTYWNNSPDELTHVFFHLYQNAFQPGSYSDNLSRNNNSYPRYGKYESQKKGTEVLKLTAGGVELKTELDNTILKVILAQPLKSGESIAFDIEFKTYFDGRGEVRRRMKLFDSYGNKHYDGVHWYPRIAVYDRKFGWETDQHLGKEFYGDFGAYDVELTFANNFVLGATGNLLNSDEVLPAELRQKLDIKNFAQKKWESEPSVVIPYDSTIRKTWKFHAENVHDFAFTADPTYRIGEAEWNGVKCIALAQEPHSCYWQNAAEYAAKTIQTFSEDFGMYVYPKMIVADARDGMEYPMLTLDGGYDPDYRGLFVHEIGHNWFYGMVGNNETYRAFLDEGFTQFLTAWGMKHIDGDTILEIPSGSGYIRKFQKPDLVMDARVYRNYLFDAMRFKDSPINTHSDMFGSALNHGGGYRHVYYKTATMLYNLQYVLGDELFLNTMKNYFNRWKICHPYPEDFRNSIIQFTKADLNWFFDQWMETTKRIDYGITSVRKGKEKGQYVITFKRKDLMQMPIDFSVLDKDGNKSDFYIPNTWFEKKIPPGSGTTTLPRWIGWDEKLKPTYQATVTVPAGIKNVIIDPSGRLADVNQLDNSYQCPLNIEFDSRVFNWPDRRAYEMFVRPDLWYNGYDGLKAGMHANGSYLNYFHQFDANLWFNAGAFQQHKRFADRDLYKYEKISWRINYRTPMDKFMKGSTIFFSGKQLEGLQGFKGGFNKKSQSEKTLLYTFFKSMYRPDRTSLNYLLYPNEWNPQRYNNTLNIGLDHHYAYRFGTGDINFNLRSSTLGSDYNYSAIALTVINNNKLSNKLTWKTRTFAQFGQGDSWAPESQLFLAGANPEQLMDNPFTRSVGFMPEMWTGYGEGINHFHAGGGLNLRGYAGYVAPELVGLGRNQNVRQVYKGTAGVAFNTELEFGHLLRFNPRFLKNTFQLVPYLFGDAGVLNYSYDYEYLSFPDIRADAGLGAALTIQRWGPFEKTNPVTVRIDFPFFVNRLPAVEDSFLSYKRFVVGINRAF